MNSESWDSECDSSSDSSDLPDIVSSDEELKPWFPPFKPPQLSYEVLIPKRWCYLRTSVLKRYCHIVKVQLLSPILFGRPYKDELCRKWAVQAALIEYEDYSDPQDLDLKTLKIIDLLESAHRALLVYALKRPLLIQFVRVVNENLVKCSKLEEAIEVVKQQMVFRHAWEMTVGNEMQVASILALTSLYYFNLIKQYTIDQNNPFEQFENQCFQEEKQTKTFFDLWEQNMKKQHYEPAVKTLNKAIGICAFSHLLYEKRSYCYLQLCQFKKAWSDAKRCIVLKPHSIEGQYLFAGAQCGKGWYARALKANSLAIQICQRKGLNIKGLTEQRELIQTEQLLSSKEKQIEKETSDSICSKESFDSESSTVEEDDEVGGGESREDEIPSVEDMDVWLENTKDDVQAEQQQNERSLHFNIPFLSLNFNASNSDSENDRFDKLTQGHGSNMLSGGHTSDSESGSSLREDQQHLVGPCNSENDRFDKLTQGHGSNMLSGGHTSDSESGSSLREDQQHLVGPCISINQEKGPPEIGTRPLGTDSGKDGSIPSTGTGSMGSSSTTDPGKDMNSVSLFSEAHQLPFESGIILKATEQVNSENKQPRSCSINTEQQEEQKLEMSTKVEERLLKCKLKEASEALMVSNFRNAQENYLYALKLIKEKKVYNLTTMEYILIEYACGSAFLGNTCNLIQDLLEAEQHFKKIIEEFQDEDSSHFNCLSFYGLSRVHLRWNRYKEARSSIEKSLKLVENNLVPSFQTWPGTDTIIEETRDGVLKDLLNSLLKDCLCPPRPDAVCHYRFCSTHIKRDIYRSDPDFKGFVRVHCSCDCHIEYHLYCWKRCKIKEFQDKIEKDILGLDCLTPDCMGIIWKVDIFQDSRQKTIESSKSKESKGGRSTATKQSGNIFNLKKIASKKEKKYQNSGKRSSNFQQHQFDTPNRKSGQSELKDETFGARKKEGKNKKNRGPSNEWIKNNSGYLEEATAEVRENNDMNSKMENYCQKEEKMQNSISKTDIDDVLQDELSSLNNIKTCDAAVLTDPIKPFESKKKTFMILYHEKTHLLKSYEKSQNVHDQLCSATQNEIKTCKEKHEQLLFNEKKLKNDVIAVKAQLRSIKEKLHDKREYQSQEFGALQEELKSMKNNLERNKKTLHEIDAEIQTITERREKQANDEEKLQKLRDTTKENCKDSAIRLLSVQFRIEEWKKYTKLYFLNFLHKEAVENVKFYSAQKARNVNSLEVSASHDMWEKRMKGIQRQITLINVAGWPQDTGDYTDGAPYTDSYKWMPNQQRLSPSPTRIEMNKNVGVGGTSTSAEIGWFSPGIRPRSIDADLSSRIEGACIPSVWPSSYSKLPPTDGSQSEFEQECRMFTDPKKKTFLDRSFQLATHDLEITTPLPEAKQVRVPDSSLSGLWNSSVSWNIPNNFYETGGVQFKSFNGHFNHLQSAQPIIHASSDFQAMQTQRPFGGASRVSSSQTDEARSSYHAVMEQLFFKFPAISKAQLHLYINKVKEENGGTLSSLSAHELVRQVSYHVHQGTLPEMTYASPTNLPSFEPINCDKLFFPSHHTLHSDQTGSSPDGFNHHGPVGVNSSGFESLPLGDLLEMEGCFDEL
ncbi:golgin subfamily B member 1-like isoform X2 [Narcine bancroftii]|uniref:golgin subfamily B member 1-like isoform X2 n=1 Tax=Narcine bancroftii TaxID=1343680 RepID=UPI003832101A